MSVVIAVVIVLAMIGTGVLRRDSDDDAGGALVGSEASWQLEHADDLRGDLGAVEVNVERIIDGDTLDVRLFGGETLRVRLYGVDTPERGEDCYDEATNRLAALAGTEVLLVSDERLEDRNGRALRYLFTTEGDSIDAALVGGGYARAWEDDGSFRDQLVALEADAREADRGCLWSG
jgi:micrococcal nuclease